MNVITLDTIDTSNDENDDVLFIKFLKEVEAKMRESILSYMNMTMLIDDKHKGVYYVVQFRSESYILQEDMYMKGYEPPIKAYVEEIVCGVRFFLPNVKYWFTKMNK